MSTATATTTITSTAAAANPEPQTQGAPTNSTTATGPKDGGPVRAVLNFYTPPTDGSTPWNYVDIPKEGPQRNYSAVAHDVVIEDVRGRESEFEVDRHGFAAVPAPKGDKEADFSSDEAVTETYYPQVRQFLTDHLSGNPTNIVLFDHTIRRHRPDAHRAPVQRTHIDQTRRSAEQRVKFHMGDDAAPDLLKGRVRIVNVWRPLNGPVETHPLAMGDSATVTDDLLVPIEHRYPTRTGETAGVKFSPDTKYYYWSAMRNDERILLQCYDSQSGTRVPHSAFEDPRSNESSRPRESIEVRALVFG